MFSPATTGCLGVDCGGLGKPGERRLLALQRRLGRSKASRLCPGNSDVDLFGYGESVINLNAEIPDCALDLVIIPPACD